MRVLLDTQVLYIATGITEARFSKRVTDTLEDPNNERLLSSVSIMEIAIKRLRGLTTMTEAHVHQAAADLRLTIIPFAPQHAYRLFKLPQHHRDPFDRMLIATALVEGVPIVSSDTQFKRYKALTVLW